MEVRFSSFIFQSNCTKSMVLAARTFKLVFECGELNSSRNNYRVTKYNRRPHVSFAWITSRTPRSRVHLSLHFSPLHIWIPVPIYGNIFSWSIHFPDLLQGTCNSFGPQCQWGSNTRFFDLLILLHHMFRAKIFKKHQTISNKTSKLNWKF